MTANAPAVSVVIAAYNSGRTILECVNSVLRQTVVDIEVIVCNDGSTDDTSSILDSIRDQRLKVVSNEHNQGAGYSRDRAISLAAGHWIALVDADDLWTPQRLERLLSISTADYREIIFDDLLLCHDSPEPIPFARVYGPDGFGAGGRAVAVDVVTYVRGRRLVASPIFTRQLVLESKATHGRRPAGQDIDFRLALIAFGATLRYLPEAHYLYRMRAGSLSARPTGPSYIRIFEDALTTYMGNPVLGKALEAKVMRLRSKYELVTHLRRWKLFAAMYCAIRHPGAARDLAMNVRDLLHYEASRFRHGIGTRRLG